MGDGDGIEVSGWVEAAAFMGPAYLRYSFTKGTEQEVAFLVDALGLRPGARVLDVGCGPGRHSLALARRGFEVVGVDLAPRFVALAAAAGGARFAVADARRLPLPARAFDAVVSLCQGGFGLVGGDDPAVVDELARILRPGGRLALSAFSAYFAVRHLEEHEELDCSAGVTRERTRIRADDGTREAAFELETSVFTPRELRLLLARSGLEATAIWSVAPGDYQRRPPDLDHPEWLVVAERVVRGPGGRLVR